MILFDVNILIYAHREDQVAHAYFREHLERVIREGQPYGLTPGVAGAFFRILSQPSFPNGPTPMPLALAAMESLITPAQSHWVYPGRRHWEIFSQLCRATNASGKRVSDAQHAAIAIEHAATWVSRDTDFERYQPHGLRWECWQPGQAN